MERKDTPTRLEHRDLMLRDVRLEMKARKSGDAVRFEGYGSVFNELDSWGDIMLPGAFAESLAARMPTMLFGHDMRQVPGKYIEATEDDHGLLLVGELTPDHTLAKDLEASMRHKAISGMSVGGYTSAADWVEEDGQLIGRRIKGFDLYEVSIVSIPAVASARIDAGTIKAAFAECDTLRSVERVLREQHGFTRASAETLISRVKAILQGDPAERETPEAGELARIIKAATIPTSLFGATP